MSFAILAALVAGALCLGMLSMLVPFGRRDDVELEEGRSFDDLVFDIGGPVIDLEPNR